MDTKKIIKGLIIVIFIVIVIMVAILIVLKNSLKEENSNSIINSASSANFARSRNTVSVNRRNTSNNRNSNRNSNNSNKNSSNNASNTKNEANEVENEVSDEEENPVEENEENNEEENSQEGNQVLYHTAYTFGFGSRRVLIYGNGEVYEDVEIEDPEHEENYQYLKTLSEEEVQSLVDEINSGASDEDMDKFVINLVYGVDEFNEDGSY